MGTSTEIVDLQHRFADDLPELCTPWQAAPVEDPAILVLNEALAAELGLDPTALGTPEGAALLVGTAPPQGSRPVAMAYAGHQFGGYSPRLGDGRALLLGELTAPDGRLVDLHLKGSGRTPFARGGDGLAAVGPMLRELVISEAMHALGIPTTRALAVTATGRPVLRQEGPLPGAVLARIAASHLRVGTFQYAAAAGEADLVARLADHAIARHHPAAASAPNRFLALFEAVVEAQAQLVARWMLVGFIHGVMNTDNTTISGETIDYGPCAFLDVFDPTTVYSSIDHGGRYAFGNQPSIVQWNLARLAEAMLPLLDADEETAVAVATERLHAFPGQFRGAWLAGMRAKLGLTDARDGDGELIDDLLRTMHQQQADFTATFRGLSALARGDDGPITAWLLDASAIESWIEQYLARLDAEGRDRRQAAMAMDAVNPVYVPRNHLVEEALAAATEGELDPLERLLSAIRHPFDEQPGLERYALPAPPGFGDSYRTFCGT